MSSRDFRVGHEPDREELRDRIAELEATVRVLLENEEKLHNAHAETINKMALLGGHKAALLGVIEEAVENLSDADDLESWSAVDRVYADLENALRRYGA